MFIVLFGDATSQFYLDTSKLNIFDIFDCLNIKLQKWLEKANYV